jgi:hypothetical protein
MLSWYLTTPFAREIDFQVSTVATNLRLSHRHSLEDVFTTHLSKSHKFLHIEPAR